MKQTWSWLRHNWIYRKVNLLTSWNEKDTSFEPIVARKMTWQHWLDATETRCNARTITTHSLNWLKGVMWLTKGDWLGDKMNTQVFRNENVDRFHVQRWTVSCHWYKWKDIPLSLNFPTMKDECLFFVFTSSKRVTNTRCSSLEYQSILICFKNLWKEWFIPSKGLSLFYFMSPMKVNSISFMFRESERIQKKTPWGSFFVWFSL